MRELTFAGGFAGGGVSWAGGTGITSQTVARRRGSPQAVLAAADDCSCMTAAAGRCQFLLQHRALVALVVRVVWRVVALMSLIIVRAATYAHPMYVHSDSLRPPTF